MSLYLIVISTNILGTDLGAVLGFFCSHEYAHAHDDPQWRVPRSLKGVDMAIYAVFRALGLQIEILPILRLPGRSKREQPRFGGLDLEGSGRQQSFARKLQRAKHRLCFGRRGGHVPPELEVDDLRLDYDVYNSDEEVTNDRNPEATDHEDYKDVHTRLQTILRMRKLYDISTAPDPVIAGTKLHERVEDTSLDIMDSSILEVIPP